MIEEIILITVLSVIAFITSTITGALGMGGGLLLLSILPSFIPPNAIIPVHGAVQLASNFSRFLFGVKDLCLRPFIFFTAGSVAGAYIGAHFLTSINLDYIPIFLSVFIILILWTPFLNLLLKIPGKYLSLGFIQTSLALYIGSTGPLSTSFFIKDSFSNSQVIITNAAINTIINVFKLIVYFFIGFVFFDYLYIVLFMSFFSILGSYVGTSMRMKINQDIGRLIIKLLITLICLKNLFYTLALFL